MAIYYPPSTNAIQKTLDAQLLSGTTASMTLNNVTGIQNKKGLCVIDAVDANGASTPAKREYVAFTGVSGSTLTGLTRNADGGSSDQDHAVGAIVQFVPDVLQQQELIDEFLVEHNDGGTHKSATVTSLKATGAEINTGTEDAKIVTPKAIADSEVSTASKTETLTNKTLTSPVLQGTVDGWISANETWAYASATTITVPSGAAAKYVKGDKIKLTQSTVKYFYIVGVADTVLTVTGGADYAVTDAAISANYYSHASSPIGFPVRFMLSTPTWTTTGTAFTNQPANNSHYFWIFNNFCFYTGTASTHATSGGTGIFIATFTTGQLPPRVGAGEGSSRNISSSVGGWSTCTSSNVVRIAKYDGFAIAGNSEFFNSSCSFYF
jgi:hypothetical protein